MPKNDAFKRLLGEYLVDPRGRNLLWAHIETMPERLAGEKKSEIKQCIDDIGRLKNQSPHLDRLIQRISELSYEIDHLSEQNNRGYLTQMKDTVVDLKGWVSGALSTLANALRNPNKAISAGRVKLQTFWKQSTPKKMQILLQLISDGILIKESLDLAELPAKGLSGSLAQQHLHLGQPICWAPQRYWKPEAPHTVVTRPNLIDQVWVSALKDKKEDTLIKLLQSTPISNQARAELLKWAISNDRPNLMDHILEGVADVSELTSDAGYYYLDLAMKLCDHKSVTDLLHAGAFLPNTTLGFSNEFNEIVSGIIEIDNEIKKAANLLSNNLFPHILTAIENGYFHGFKKSMAYIIDRPSSIKAILDEIDKKGYPSNKRFLTEAARVFPKEVQQRLMIHVKNRDLQKVKLFIESDVPIDGNKVVADIVAAGRFSKKCVDMVSYIGSISTQLNNRLLTDLLLREGWLNEVNRYSMFLSLIQNGAVLDVDDLTRQNFEEKCANRVLNDAAYKFDGISYAARIKYLNHFKQIRQVVDDQRLGKIDQWTALDRFVQLRYLDGIRSNMQGLSWSDEFVRKMLQAERSLSINTFEMLSELIRDNKLSLLEEFLSSKKDAEKSKGLLSVAANYGRLAICERLIQLGSDVNEIHQGQTPLISHINAGPDEKIIRVLLKAGADLDGALVSVLQKSNKKVLKLLLNYGATLTEQEIKGIGTIHGNGGPFSKELDIMSKMKPNGPILNSIKPLRDCLKISYYYGFKIGLSKIKDPTIFNRKEFSDLLMAIIKKKKWRYIDLILESAAYKKQPQKYGLMGYVKSPNHMSDLVNEWIENDDAKALKRLIKAGLPASDLFGGNWPLICVAVREEAFKVVRLLIEEGADLAASIQKNRAFFGQTALHIAAKQDNDRMLRQLIVAGAPLDATYMTKPHNDKPYQVTPMLMAIQADRQYNLRALVDSGASFTISSQSVWEMAIKNERIEILEYLCVYSKHASLNLPIEQTNILNAVQETENEKMIGLLVEHGVLDLAEGYIRFVTVQNDLGKRYLMYTGKQIVLTNKLALIQTEPSYSNHFLELEKINDELKWLKQHNGYSLEPKSTHRIPQRQGKSQFKTDVDRMSRLVLEIFKFSYLYGIKELKRILDDKFPTVNFDRLIFRRGAARVAPIEQLMLNNNVRLLEELFRMGVNMNTLVDGATLMEVAKNLSLDGRLEKLDDVLNWLDRVGGKSSESITAEDVVADVVIPLMALALYNLMAIAVICNCSGRMNMIPWSFWTYQLCFDDKDVLTFALIPIGYGLKAWIYIGPYAQMDEQKEMIHYLNRDSNGTRLSAEFELRFDSCRRQFNRWTLFFSTLSIVMNESIFLTVSHKTEVLTWPPELLLLAVQMGDKDATKILVDRGREFDNKQMFEDLDKMSDSFLTTENQLSDIYENRQAILSKTTKERFDQFTDAYQNYVSCLGRVHQNPILAAAQHGHIDIVEVLLPIFSNDLKLTDEDEPTHYNSVLMQCLVMLMSYGQIDRNYNNVMKAILETIRNQRKFKDSELSILCSIAIQKRA